MSLGIHFFARLKLENDKKFKRKPWIRTICKTRLLQHLIRYCHVCKMQTKKIVTYPPDFEPILGKATAKQPPLTVTEIKATDQSHHRPSLSNVAGLYPTSPITAQRHRPLPNIAGHCPFQPLPKIGGRLPPLPIPADLSQPRTPPSKHKPPHSSSRNPPKRERWCRWPGIRPTMAGSRPRSR